MLRTSVVILWTSFVAAGIGLGIIFTLVDPMELVVLGEHLHATRTAVYSVSFFVLWAICALSAGLCSFLMADWRPGVDAGDKKE